MNFVLTLLFLYQSKEGENMGMFAHHFKEGNNLHEGVVGKIVDNSIDGRLNADDNKITSSNVNDDIHRPKAEKNNQGHQVVQKYISLQSPTREDNPITSFVKPPDFISLKPLTQDEETAILMQVL